MTVTMELNKLMSREEFEKVLRGVGKTQYHNLHPFHKLLHGGKLNKGQVQAWALNRYYYQCNIPIKDCALMSRMKDPKLRRIWRKRVFDHDGRDVKDTGGKDTGGIERWFILTDALGLDRDYVKSTEGILPITRFAVDAYIDFVNEKSVLEGVTSSLSELFAPDIHRERIALMMKNYKFTNEKNMSYFVKRLGQAPIDIEQVLSYALDKAKTREEQENVYNALVFKMQMLWAMLDALHYSYCEPGLIPPGAFKPEG